MKPDFALSLSFEGIRLLARAAGGWNLLGQARLDDPNLTIALASLRDTAVDHSSLAFRTKLIVPNDQIRYLSVDTGHVSTAERIDRVRRALDGATPYPVEHLVYDVCIDGPMTHVAAVARETLEEAEAFALTHKFNPVSFVAIPEDAAFLGEPFFGPTEFSETALHPGDRVEPDGVAVVVVGSIDAGAQPAQTPTAEVTQAPDPSPTPSGAAPTVAEPRPAPTPEPEPVAEPVQDLPPEEAEAEPDLPVVGFSSKRKTPTLGGATRSTIAPRIEDDTPAPIVAVKPAPKPAQPAAAATPADPVSSDQDSASNWKTRFLSKRKDEEVDAAPPPDDPSVRAARLTAPALANAPLPAPAAMQDTETGDERQRMTIFGARERGAQVGKPRHLGLILTAMLMVFLAGVAAWASIFMDDELSSLFGRAPDTETADLAPPEAAPAPQAETAQPPAEEGPQVAAIDPEDGELTDTDAAVLDALRTPTPEADTTPSTVLDPDTAESRYAVTGIWERAPDPPAEPGQIDLDDLYITSIDRRIQPQDAVALPREASFLTDLPLGEVATPAGPGARFTFDDRGLILPTPEGALSPEGFTVILGRPPVVPPQTPTRVALTPEPETEAAAALSQLRPRLRPDGLVEQTERAQLGGRSRAELARVRPQLRPRIETAEEEIDETPTAQAVAASVTPRLRPRNMAQIVRRASRETASTQPRQVAAAATVAPTTVAPRIPSSTSATRAATVRNAINLRKVNLIGVYGTPSNRRALVRLPNGRYKKVQIGDRLDGGRISAIGDSELRYQKNGRNLVLKIPTG